jgi:3',5'-cyclic AMP phosphodiesterase CpdA
VAFPVGFGSVDPSDTDEEEPLWGGSAGLEQQYPFSAPVCLPIKATVCLRMPRPLSGIALRPVLAAGAAVVFLIVSACAPSSSAPQPGSSEAPAARDTAARDTAARDTAGAAAHEPARQPAPLPSTAPTPYPDRIVLTWEKDPSSSLSVTWRTDTTVTGARAQIAPARGEPSFYTKARTVPADTDPLRAHRVDGERVSARYHSVTFEGLASDSLYAYRVGDGERWSEWFQARTAAAGPEPFSFVYVGDAQNNVRSHWSRLIRQAFTDAPAADFMVHAGDLVNNAHRNVEWGHWNAAGSFIQSMVPNVAVPGNHEYAGYTSRRVEATFSIEVEASASEMTGTITLPDGDTAPLTARRKGTPPSDGPMLPGTWQYSIGGYSGALEIEGQEGSYRAALRDDQGEYPLQNISAGGDRLSGDFRRTIEREGEERLSIHWRPQFALPTNGPEGMEETVYHLDHQGMRVVALNSNVRDSSRLERQTEWLEATLQDAAQDDGIRWVVATFHHPMFSSGEGRNNERLREKWVPLFDEYNVDLVMQGHDHTYARGRRTQNLKQGVNARSPVGGTVYVNSVSGAKMYEIKPDRWEGFDRIEMQRGGENTQLYQVVRVQADTMKYRSYTATGTLYDAFDLVRQPDGPNRMVERPVAGAPERTHENTLEYARP